MINIKVFKLRDIQNFKAMLLVFRNADVTSIDDILVQLNEHTDAQMPNIHGIDRASGQAYKLPETCPSCGEKSFTSDIDPIDGTIFKECRRCWYVER